MAMKLRSLQREWYGKLRATGFIDLEGPSGGLSDRGNLHPISETYDERQRLAQRVEDGSSYTAWAESVLQNHRFPSRESRECWRLHAQGTGEADIATALTVTRWRVREHLAEVKDQVSKVSRVKRWRNAQKQRLSQLRSLVRRSDPETLTALVALMLRPELVSRSGY